MFLPFLPKINFSATVSPKKRPFLVIRTMSLSGYQKALLDQFLNHWSILLVKFTPNFLQNASWKRLFSYVVPRNISSSIISVWSDIFLDPRISLLRPAYSDEWGHDSSSESHRHSRMLQLPKPSILGVVPIHRVVPTFQIRLGGIRNFVMLKAPRSISWIMYSNISTSISSLGRGNLPVSCDS